MRSPLARFAARLVPLLAPALLVGCDEAPMTTAEALEALAQSSRSSSGEVVANEPIEISTEFTIGGALEEAAQELAAFWQSQQPCTTVTVAGDTVTTDFGGLTDACTFEGSTYAGVAEVTVIATGLGELEVQHEWLGLTDGEVQVDGGATVTWSGEDLTRRVVTEHTWTDLADGATVDVVGDHVQAPLDGEGGALQDLLGGITMEGDRTWTTDGEDWSLEMTDLEIRWIDPVPQAGTYLITNPDGKALTITFSRVDETTIQADVSGTRRPLTLHINALGLPEEVDATE